MKLVAIKQAALLMLVAISITASTLLGVTSRAVQQIKAKRPNWVCPNGNSFETCTHDCKWIVMKDGKPDKERERQCGEEIAAHSPQLKKIYELYESVYNSCGKEADMIQERTPCNYFAGMVMEQVYGVKDFKGILSPYRSASEIYSLVLSSRNWQNVDAETAIDLANQGYAVVAFVPTHVAVVVPSGYRYSDKWRAYTPQVASMFIDDPKKGKPSFRCMPCFANEAFGGQPQYYVRYKTTFD
jgi:hypothetical protein